MTIQAVTLIIYDVHKLHSVQPKTLNSGVRYGTVQYSTVQQYRTVQYNNLDNKVQAYCTV